jgi:uncharacterized protein YpmB
MREIPALLKIRQTESKNVSSGISSEKVKNIRQEQSFEKICRLLLSKSNQNRLYTIVDYDKVDK